MFTFISPLNQYLANLLKLAKYEYDEATKTWCAYIDEFPGIYAQQSTIEETRKELEEMLEEYILLNLAEGLPLPNFNKLSGIKFKKHVEAKINQTVRVCA